MVNDITFLLTDTSGIMISSKTQALSPKQGETLEAHYTFD